MRSGLRRKVYVEWRMTLPSTTAMLSEPRGEDFTSLLHLHAWLHPPQNLQPFYPVADTPCAQHTD